MVSSGFGLPVWAEGGSAQSVMSLVVPPNDSDASDAASDFESADALGRPVYMANTRTSVLQAAGKVVFRVWVSP
jgi:hypothetical protein